jgi:hypothetical protein
MRSQTLNYRQECSKIWNLATTSTFMFTNARFALCGMLRVSVYELLSSHDQVFWAEHRCFAPAVPALGQGAQSDTYGLP